jgi:ATP-dependent protease HslVU (ClpYQ) ATPase subunit
MERMMKKENNIQDQLGRIVDLMVDDVLEASNEEILQEASEENRDVEDEAQKVHALIQEVVFEHNRSKLEEAKKQYQAHKARNKPHLRVAEIDKKREIFRNLSSNDNTGNLTMAARKEEELSDRDIESVLQDMLELGLIDEDGNIL